MKRQLNAGFSIIELMVVVAIIGILATVAVPNFQKFQAKAKQANAKSELTGVYTAETAFFTEFGTYHGDLPYTGYTPEGITAAAESSGSCGAMAGVLRIYSVGFTGDGITGQVTGGPALPAASTCGTGGGFIFFVANNPSAVTTTSGATATASNFTASARGLIRAGGGTDSWTMNNNRVLANTVSGY